MENKNEPLVVVKKFYPNDIFGKSIIDHKIVTKSGLSLPGYCSMLYFEKLAKNRKFKLPTDEEMWKNTGMQSSYLAAKYLQSKEYLIKERDDCEITDKWYSLFKDNNAVNEFEDEIWKLYGKVGNKQEAKKQYIKARKIASKEEIIAGIIKYKKHLKDPKYNWKNQMVGSRFFNPSNKHWEDVYESSKTETNTYSRTTVKR